MSFFALLYGRRRADEATSTADSKQKRTEIITVGATRWARGRERVRRKSGLATAVNRRGRAHRVCACGVYAADIDRAATAGCPATVAVSSTTRPPPEKSRERAVSLSVVVYRRRTAPTTTRSSGERHRRRRRRKHAVTSSSLHTLYIQ